MEREVATLGGGCFWCLQPVFEELEGVLEVVVGYAGGHTPNPTYQQVCAGGTGHAEVLRITFDPDAIPFREILAVFFSVHDPTTPNRQGADRGTQYRSLLLFDSEAQRQTAEAVIREIEDEGLWPAPVVTEVRPFEAFYPAEEVHQAYYRKNPSQGYCRVVIDPKLARFRKRFAQRLRGASGPGGEALP